MVVSARLQIIHQLKKSSTQCLLKVYNSEIKNHLPPVTPERTQDIKIYGTATLHRTICNSGQAIQVSL